ncbi:hypothetical protein Zmor_019545 [Zophobas morio]|uniref:Uncharacterized protein n=1 Tax=Zophobas morio TaxID=2755281 RepID=A0AA38I3V3_9CUCU|nr:hypothetical protein Zmor_019545 [Zophobas morio]
MSVLKDVVIETEGLIAEAWIALLQTAFCINSRHPLFKLFDGFYYKNDVIIQDTSTLSQFRVYCGPVKLLITFGSETDKEKFRRFVE